MLLILRIFISKNYFIYVKKLFKIILNNENLFIFAYQKLQSLICQKKKNNKIKFSKK